jgi:hypothetical protein
MILKVKSNRLKSRGVITYEVLYCGNAYEAVVIVDLGERATLHSLRLCDGKQQTRHGTTRQRMREELLPDAEKRARAIRRGDS